METTVKSLKVNFLLVYLPFSLSHGAHLGLVDVPLNLWHDARQADEGTTDIRLRLLRSKTLAMIGLNTKVSSCITVTNWYATL